MEGEGGVTTVSKAQAIAMMATIKDEITHQDLKVQTISGRYNSKAIIKYLEMSIEDFGKLKQVYVIFICNYDPFGYDRVLYTIKNRCLEEPEMNYDDGAETIVLYTKGTKGTIS